MNNFERVLMVLLCLIVWAFTIHYAYNNGVEDGYWEHEGEENIYNCQVMT